MKYSFRFLDNKHLKGIKGKLINSMDFVLNYGTTENEIPWDIWRASEDKLFCISYNFPPETHASWESGDRIFFYFKKHTRFSINGLLIFNFNKEILIGFDLFLKWQQFDELSTPKFLLSNWWKNIHCNFLLLINYGQISPSLIFTELLLLMLWGHDIISI